MCFEQLEKSSNAAAVALHKITMFLSICKEQKFKNVYHLKIF